MKTAISVEDNLLGEADQFARRMGLSRSRLFALALQEYLQHRRNEQVLEQLNRVYSDQPDAKEPRTAARMKAKFRSTIKERW